MSKKALLILAEGAEEMEAIISADVMRRAGIDVTIAGLAGEQPVKCSRNVVIVPDSSLEEAVKNGPFDAVVLPGGLPGAANLAQSKKVGEILADQEKSGRVIGAICAAPIALQSHNIASGKKITSHPSKKGDLEASGKYCYLEEPVVVDGQLVTSRGPGTAFDFALALVEKLVSPEASKNLRGPMMLNPK